MLAQNNGWFKLHRCLISKPLFDNPKLLKVFVWCLAKATHKQHKVMVGRIEEYLQPGQFVTGRQAAAQELKLPQSTTWDYLKLLERNETIHIKSNNKYSVISVINWAEYQHEQEVTDNKRTTDGQQMDTNKNGNNGDNKIPYAAIVEILNKEAGTKYRSTTKKTRDLIKARWNEDFREADFTTVIKKKTIKWKGNPEYEIYLRPETLFGPKFEGYLNEPWPKKEPGNYVPDYKRL